MVRIWDETERPDFIEIAYSSERSIEDELDRTSKAELPTVAISYFVMFIYVTFSLGHIRSWKTMFVSKPKYFFNPFQQLKLIFFVG